MSEEWRGVPGFEGSYQVSDQGRVRSLDRIVMCHSPAGGMYPSLKKGRLLKPDRLNFGHEYLYLGERHESRHLNGMESCNRLTNLEWATRSRNHLDRKQHRGFKPRNDLSAAEKRKIRMALDAGQLSSAEIQEKFDIGHGTLCRIRAGIGL